MVRSKTLPHPDLFVYMYVRKEAVLSSQIEGTQSSLQDVLAAEAHILSADQPRVPGGSDRSPARAAVRALSGCWSSNDRCHPAAKSNSAPIRRSGARHVTQWFPLEAQEVATAPRG